MASFLLRSSFFRTTTCSTVASSKAPADYRTVRQHSGKTSKTMDINPSLQICGWNKRVNSLMAVPFVRGHRSMFRRTPRNTCVYTRHPMFVTATSGGLTRLPAKLSKNGMRVQTSADRWSKIKLRV